MKPDEVLRIVDAIHRDKNIDPGVVFEAIEQALVSAATKHYGEEREISVTIDRETGTISGTLDSEPLDPEETIGRIGAQTAKQVIIQKIREAERDALYEEYEAQTGQMVTGVVQRYEGGAATVALSNTEAILPRGEQIPGETHHSNERVRATVFEVRKAGARVKIILSRIRPQLVQRLFEQEIPEIAEGVIEIKAMAREPGYRSKVAVASADQRVDCVGACVGVRGNRIKNIVDELAGERIDIVRWNDDLQVLIPNALQPAEVEDVILCQMLGRAIVLVREDQLSLAIGRRGQNVRLGSKLCGWDIEIMTQEELGEQIDRAVAGFAALDGLEEELAVKLVEQGFMSYDDLSVIEPDALMEMGALTQEQVDHIVEQAEVKAEEAEQAAAEERRRQREQERREAAVAEAEAATARSAAAEPGPPAAEGETADSEPPAEGQQPEESSADAATQPETAQTGETAEGAETGETSKTAKTAGEGDQTGEATEQAAAVTAEEAPENSADGGDVETQEENSSGAISESAT
ncbi:MAG: transcription termination factor NusA [Planctomycetales bacterium]|nr:transcription termination factor NusA [Planctomycetales bacterium]NIM08617.1 transcription termination factor NusA [Planctomycetales bacterium]NIN08085.1 transcription termination factor NusA [Planctomycetales bacterium]NIN77219.1 transcription termination factor NusA [Planctomycetales bacterium]NIO34401.1 transcription termination factor NusA [Planctomycetales bacterium]